MQYNESQKRQIWDNTTKPIIASNGVYLHNLYALDYRNNEVHWNCFGDRESEFGWEIDHIIPVALGGRTIPRNLRVSHWKPNAILGGMLSARLNNRC